MKSNLWISTGIMLALLAMRHYLRCHDSLENEPNMVSTHYGWYILQTACGISPDLQRRCSWGQR